MKRSILLATLIFVIASLGFSQGYEHVARVTEPDGISVGAVALSSTGDIYYGQFNGTASKFNQLNDILLNGVYNPSYAVVTVSTETKTPAGRGINDVKVDSAGNIYIQGTGGSAADTILKKFGPEPSHSVLWEMGQGGLTGGEELRINGIEILDANTLLIGKAFDTLAFKSTATGTNVFAEISGGSVYQRAFALNTSNNDIYAGKNGANKDSSLNLWSGGTPAVPAGYTSTNDLLPGTGVATDFGVATQAVAYNPTDNQLLITDKVAVGVRIYNISGSGAATNFTEAQFLDGMTVDEYAGITGLAYGEVNGKKFIVLSATIGVAPDPIEFVIDIYTWPPLSEDLWMQY